LCATSDLMAEMQIREKIVEGRLNKLKAEQALLPQAYIRSESNETVEDVLKQKVAELGEKISIRRFVRFNLGEGLEKKTEDFAAEVAAQTEAMEAAPAAPEAPKVGTASPCTFKSCAAIRV
jgi:elongation factor Ts